ncbi:MAG: leucine-rich repeat protein [Lachnospiraceae bacterium]|nr:leucine-rich repeat protein [Lachnospiraceae bacterium]
MMVDYDDTVTHAVTRRGNFLIGAGAFEGNELTTLDLPEGVIFIGSRSFAKNKLTSVTIPHTFWWLENSAFAYNEITKVNFPKTCDFQAQIHAFAFSHNQIKSVRLPDYMEVVEKKSFYWNPGMEECPKDAPEKEQEFGGVVYMYTDNKNLFDMERIHHMGRTADSQHSWHQKLILGSLPDTEETWNADDFTFDGTTITGLSESGIAKRKDNRELALPDKTPDGKYVTAIGKTTADTGLFATADEQFTKVTLPAKLETIGDRAFVNNGITKVEFPKTLKSIGVAAFQRNKLECVILLDSVTTLGGGAFGTNATIKKIVLSKGLTEIAPGAFGSSDAANFMTGLTELTIPEGITKIGNNAFAGNNIHNIVIPSTVKTIDRLAFSTKEYLTDPCTLTLPEGLETIGANAFRNKSIASVVLPTTLKRIEKTTFRREYSSGADSGKTKLYVSTEEQYNDTTNFPQSDYHQVIFRAPGQEDKWNAEDFTYGTITQDLYPATDMSAVTKITGVGITGFSEAGLEKLDKNKDLVIPAKDADRNPIVGIGAGAFQKKGITSVTFPKGVMTSYSGNDIAEGLTERGNFIIQSSAFLGNELTSVDFPEGVIYIGGTAFKSNQLQSVKFSHTIWHIASQAFATNQITIVEFPKTCDFNLNLDNMSFAQNKIKSVRLPDRTEKVTNSVFFQNTGKEPVSDSAPNANYKKGGVVYMYNENVDLSKKGMITHTEGEGTGTGTSGTKSWVQKFIFGEMPAEEQPWNTSQFEFDGTTIKGFNEAGLKKVAAGETEVPLPATNKEGEAITAIAASAFDTKGLTKVTIPETVTSIGNMAFRGNAITEITIPDSVITLGTAVFTNCASLEKVTLSKALKVISPSTFNFTKLKELEIPEGVQTIGRMAFNNVPLASLSLPSTLKTIDKQAFKGNQLAKVEIPASVETIGQSAFSQDVEGPGLAPRMTSLVLHEGLKEIGKTAFEKTLLTTVNIPSSLEKLADTAFVKGEKGQVRLYSANKKHLELVEKVFYPEYTDKNDGSGHKVVYDQIAGSGWSHEDFTFEGNKVTGWSEQGNKTRKSDAVVKEDARTLVIPSVNPETLEPITEVGGKAFEIPEGEWVQKKEGVESPNGMDTVILPDTLTTIGVRAFRYNKIKNVEIPASVTKIGESAFNSNQLKKLVIPDTVTDLESGAFSANEITELTLSKNVTVIPAGAFSMNIRLDHVDIPDTVTEIGEMAFAGARLTSLTIPASVTKIGRKAFHLHHIEELVIPGNVKEVGESAFEGTFKAITLKKLTIENGVEKIGKYAFKEGYLESVDIPESVTELADDAFYANAGTNNDHVVVVNVKTKSQFENFKSSDCQKVVYVGAPDPVDPDPDKPNPDKPNPDKPNPDKPNPDKPDKPELPNEPPKVIKVTAKNVKLAASTYTYNGKVRKPAVKVAVNSKKVAASNYTVKYSKGRKNVGTYKVTVTMKNKYIGKVTKTFKINPKGTAIKSVKRGKRQIKVTWSKQNKQTTGYKIQYSRNSKFNKSVKTTTVSKNRYTSKTIKKLTKNKRYYVRIRTYKKVGKTTYYSKWSKAKSVKVK